VPRPGYNRNVPEAKGKADAIDFLDLVDLNCAKEQRRSEHPQGK
jgi:hypothetical protein